MNQFPATLPLAMRSGYSINHVSPMVRTDLASGRARQRRAFTSVPSMVNLQWFFTEIEARLFEGWFRDDLGAADGAAWFEMTLRTPLGLQQYQCRFAEMYRGPDLVAIDSYQISATVEIVERPILLPGYATILPGFVAQPDIFDRAMNQEWPAA